MEDILDFLNKHRELHITDIIKDNDEITHLYFECDDLYFCAIAPHSGNNYQFLLRANPKKTFDRWSVADLQIPYITAQRLIDYFNIDDFRKQLLDIYVDYYNEEYGFDELDD